MSTNPDPEIAPPVRETLRERLRRETADLLADVGILARVMIDPEAPWHVRLLLFLIVAYVVSPLDLIPDFIPVLGMLDEIVLVPLALRLAWRLLPPALVKRYQQAPVAGRLPSGVKITGVALVVLVWLTLTALAVAAFSD